MWDILLQFFLFLSLSALDTFFHSLTVPFQNIELLPITVMLFFLFKGFESALFPALLLGIISSYLNLEPIGFSSIIFLGSTTAVYALRDTIITHENITSIFILSMAFHAIFAIGATIREPNFSLVWFQESVFSILVNAFFTFLFFIVIRKTQKQLAKRFIPHF